MRTMKQARPSLSPLEELFENFPRGLALLELNDPADVSTWRLAAINDLASTLVTLSMRAPGAEQKKAQTRG